MGIRYAADVNLDVSQVAALYERATLRRPTRDTVRMGRMLEHANLVVGAWDGERLIGVARALTDFGWVCYLADLAVDPDYQRRGVGRELIRRVREYVGPEISIVLRAAPLAADYYHRIGFTHLDNAWILPGETRAHDEPATAPDAA